MTEIDFASRDPLGKKSDDDSVLLLLEMKSGINAPKKLKKCQIMLYRLGMGGKTLKTY